MGRIVATVRIANIHDAEKKITCDALVDTGSSYMVLPSAWRERLGELEEIATVPLETATQETLEGKICGPVRIQIEGFRPIYNEVVFADMSPGKGEYEPLVGYVILEQSQAAVDPLGSRLVPVKAMDLKKGETDPRENAKRARLREIIEFQCESSMEERIDRYLEIQHQDIIGAHYFAEASTECIHAYRDGYFIGAVMMSQAVNEGIIKFIAERNAIKRHKEDGTTEDIKELIHELRDKNILSQACADASTRIWGSFRNDVHHMNPKVAEIPFRERAQKNLRDLSALETEIFGCSYKQGALVPNQPKYWDVRENGTVPAFLRLE